MDSPPVRRSKRLQKQVPEEPIVPLEKISEIFKDQQKTESITTNKRKGSQDGNIKKAASSSSSLSSKGTTKEDKSKENIIKSSKQKQTSKQITTSSTSPSPSRVVTRSNDITPNSQKKFTTPPPVKRRVLRPVEIDQIHVPTTTTTTTTTMNPMEKQRIVVKKTPTMKETFPGRLEWKKKHYDKPVTSTPVATRASTAAPPKQQQNDVESCFGFDEESDDDLLEYSTLISPIPKERVQVQKGPNLILFKRVPDPPVVAEPPPPPLSPEAKFNHLYHRLHEDDEENEGDLHVNREGIRATYSNHHTKHLHFAPEVRKQDKPKSSKRIKKTKASTATTSPKKGSKGSKKENIDAEMEKWIEETNKEFEDISKVPLNLEKSL